MKIKEKKSNLYKLDTPVVLQNLEIEGFTFYIGSLASIFVRLLIYYRNLEANVLWNSSEESSNFSIRNGTGQGRVLAGIAYCIYVAGLFTLLEKRRDGCWVEEEYMGVWGYSDVNWAIAPSLSALQDMTVTVEEYALSHNLIFSTDPNPAKCKSKCMAYLKKQHVLLNMTLCETPLNQQ